MAGDATKRYPPELRERAVWMVGEVRADHDWVSGGLHAQSWCSETVDGVDLYPMPDDGVPGGGEPCRQAGVAGGKVRLQAIDDRVDIVGWDEQGLPKAPVVVVGRGVVQAKDV